MADEQTPDPPSSNTARDEPTSSTPSQQQLPSHNPPSLPTSPLPKRTKTMADTIDAAADTNKPLPSAPLLPSIAPSGILGGPTPAQLLARDAQLAAAIPLQVKLLRPDAKAPTRGSAHSAGYDLYVAEAGVVPARGQAMLGTGVSVAVPPGTYARVAPRSGLAAKHGLQTGAGVIDYDYRGEVKLLLFNHSDADFAVAPGDRMAQMVLERIVNPEVVVVEELDGTERGAGGFGSTGGFGPAPESGPGVNGA